ncbi:MAG: DUF6504 family protein [Spirochaetaceae bacterium]
MEDRKSLSGDGRRMVPEAIEPEPGSFMTESMATGIPGVPRRFRWRERTYTVARVFANRKDTGPCRHGSGERYVRRHFFDIETTDGDRMTLSVSRGTKPDWSVLVVEHPQELGQGGNA